MLYLSSGKHQQHCHGLTLVELLGCIIIIMLLGSVAVYSIQGSHTASENSATAYKLQTLNLALEQAKIQKFDPILVHGDKYEVYDYLVEHGFLVENN